MTIRPTRLALAALVAFAAACSDTPTAVQDTVEGRFDNPGASMKPAAESPTIVDIAVAASQADEPQFTILVQAVLAADLAGVLSGKGQFTVFAPTDAAFAAVLAETGLTAEQLLGNKELLTNILLYHVATGRRYAEDVLASDRIRTLNGGFVFQDSGVLTDANGRTSNIIDTDIEASNGVIHVIETVILPSLD